MVVEDAAKAVLDDVAAAELEIGAPVIGDVDEQAGGRGSVW